MKPSTIVSLFSQHLKRMFNVPPVAWANQTFDPVRPENIAQRSRPYLSVEHVPTSRVDATFTGGHSISYGYFMVSIVTGWGTAVPNRLAEQIMDHFEYPLRLRQGTEALLINSPPRLLSGFREGSYYYLPVRITYQTEKT